MGPILFRVALLALGLGVAQVALTSVAAGDPAWVPELALALALLVAGSAGFMVPLLGRFRNGGAR